jgi:beta-N-acetylhexosaminidase
MISASVFGCAGPVVGPEEAAFFREARPWGFILFGRNIETPDQVRAIVSALRETVGRPDAPVLIDQEGGRVQRLGPPHWSHMPPGRAYADVEPEIAWLGGRLIAHDLHAVGINVDCAPVVDVPTSGAHDIIGDRAHGTDPQCVARIARALAEGLITGGVAPIIKHIPGHGRAAADSHLALPVVDTPLAELEAHDFAPFRALADLPMAMTAHVVYAAVDPERPATTSPAVIDRVIRGSIGFDGLLISDDLSMKALRGDYASRARASLDAGCDVVLHCNGALDEMRAVAAGARPLDGRSLQRAQAALARLPSAPATFDAVTSRQSFEAAFAGRPRA